MHTPPQDLVKFGTSSFSSKDWLGTFYPAGTGAEDFLSAYARTFNTVEIDSTYYAVPSARTVDGWRAKTPDHFLIAAKFPRSIVHGGSGAAPAADVVLAPDKTYRDRDRFLGAISRLGSRTGPLLLQFPYFSRKVFANSVAFFNRLDRFLGDLPGEFRYAVEIRNRAWLGADFAALCEKHRAALVMVDQAWMPHGDELSAQLDPVTTDFTYIRLLGDRKEIEARTTSWDKEVIDRSERLERWADMLVQLLERRITTLVYVNNHYAGHAPATTARLRELYRSRVEERSAPG